MLPLAGAPNDIADPVDVLAVGWPKLTVAGLSPDVIGGVAGAAPKVNGDLAAGASAAELLEGRAKENPVELDVLPPNNGFGASTVGVLDAGEDEGRPNKNALWSELLTPVVLVGVVPNPPNNGEGTGAAGNNEGSRAGFCSGSLVSAGFAAAPKTEEGEGAGTSAGLAVAPNGKDCDVAGAGVSATLAGAPNAGAPKENDEVVAGAAAFADVSTNSEGANDDAGSFAGAPNSDADGAVPLFKPPKIDEPLLLGVPPNSGAEEGLFVSVVGVVFDSALLENTDKPLPNSGV